MDAFNLHWPGGDATLHTDGARCRISWRAVNGMGGSIENTDQAKKRAALGLSFAPTLLDELRQAGYGALAGELEQLAPPAAPKPEPAVKSRIEKPAAAEKPVAAKKSEPKKSTEHAARSQQPSAPVKAVAPEKKAAAAPPKARKPRVARWLETLEGPDAYEATGVRRATKWHHGKTWPEGLELKPPQGGKGEWVLKVAGDKTEYYSAESFRGVCAALAARAAFASDAFFDAFLDGCKALRQKDVTLARERWAESA